MACQQDFSQVLEIPCQRGMGFQLSEMEQQNLNSESH